MSKRGGGVDAVRGSVIFFPLVVLFPSRIFPPMLPSVKEKSQIDGCSFVSKMNYIEVIVEGKGKQAAYELVI